MWCSARHRKELEGALRGVAVTSHPSAHGRLPSGCLTPLSALAGKDSAESKRLPTRERYRLDGRHCAPLGADGLEWPDTE
jgi:hypothetical protein